MLPNGGGDGKAFESLTVESMRKFNEETPDVEGVRYFSWGAVYEPGLIDTWKWPHSVIMEKEGPNDGLVSVESSKWVSSCPLFFFLYANYLQGTYLGTLSGVNHLDLVGWINTARYKWASMMGKEIKFRPATFYMGIADMLAKEVEGVGKELQQGEEGGKGKAGAGVDLKEEEGEPRAATDADVKGDSLCAPSKHKDDSEVPPRTKSQNERRQMMDSLDTAGADVREPGAKDAEERRQHKHKEGPVRSGSEHSTVKGTSAKRTSGSGKSGSRPGSSGFIPP